MKVERRATDTQHVTLETREEDRRVIVGLAAVFYRDGEAGTEYRLWDDVVERIMPGAFDEALSRGDDVRALKNHDPNQLLGRSASGTLRLRVDERGLSYEIDPPETTTGNDTMVELGRGDITGSSFAFVPTDTVWRETGDTFIREVRSVALLDVGPVVYPAYE